MCETGLHLERSRAARRVGPGRGRGSHIYLAPTRPVWFYLLLAWIPGLPRALEAMAVPPQSPCLFSPPLLLSLLLLPYPRACWEPLTGYLQWPGGWVALGLACFPLLCLLTTPCPRVPLLLLASHSRGDLCEGHVALFLSQCSHTQGRQKGALHPPAVQARSAARPREV